MHIIKFGLGHSKGEMDARKRDFVIRVVGKNSNRRESAQHMSTLIKETRIPVSSKGTLNMSDKRCHVFPSSRSGIQAVHKLPILHTTESLRLAETFDCLGIYSGGTPRALKTNRKIELKSQELDRNVVDFSHTNVSRAQGTLPSSMPSIMRALEVFITHLISSSCRTGKNGTAVLEMQTAAGWQRGRRNLTIDTIF